MSKQTEKDVLLDHDYDGIRELDNDMPSWWVYMFYVTIVIAVIYLLYFHVFNLGDLSREEYYKEMNPDYVETGPIRNVTFESPWYATDPDITPRMVAKFADHVGENVSFERLIREAKRRANPEQLAMLNEDFPSDEIIEPVKLAAATSGPTKPTDLEPLTDAASLAAGADIFRQHCAVCHGPQGQGGIGPNMADYYWIHGGDINDIVHIINVGVPAKGMIPWDKTLRAEQIRQVGSYLISLEGSNPPNPKAPEGNPYQRN